MPQRLLLVVSWVLMVSACASSRAPEAASGPVPPSPVAPIQSSPVAGAPRDEGRFAESPAPRADSSPPAASGPAGAARVASEELEAVRATLREGERALLALEQGAQVEAKARKSGPARAPSEEDEARAPAKREKSAATPSPRPESAGGASDGRSADAEDGLGARCAVACKAFASMRRAADRMCELMGDADGECVDARGRVSRAGERVERSCPACARSR